MEDEDRVIKRLLFLEQTFDALRDESDDFRHLRMNRAILCIVVKSYFDDVDRHKRYHGSPLVDEIKQAGFTIKWIAKLRPVHFDCDDAETTRELLYINEIFAVRAGLAFMRRSPDEVPGEIYADLLYNWALREGASGVVLGLAGGISVRDAGILGGMALEVIDPRGVTVGTLGA